MLGILGIILSLVGLMYFAYRGINVLVLAPLMALFAILVSGGEPLLATYTQVFMQSLGKYVIQFFPIFLLGAVFGKVMADSGSADTIARAIAQRLGPSHAITAVVLACGLLTYGGVSLFVVAFAVFPIAVALFREAGIPKRLIPAAIALGSFTFTMTALPGTPSIQNAIPAGFFGTDTFAAPGLGLIAGLVMLVGGVLWLNRRAAAARAAGEGYGEEGGTAPVLQERPRPGFLLSVLPIVTVVALNGLFSRVVLPSMDHGYLSQAKYGGVEAKAVMGLWALIGALALGVAAALLLQRRYFENAKATVNEGTLGSLLPIFNTASEVGYGAVIASLASFVLIRDAVLNLAPGNPTISLAVAVNALAGITGSASGGMSIALQALAKTYLERATALGISPELLHRVAAISSGGFDSLPHNGAVISLLAITGLTHAKSYADIFVVSVAVPLMALLTVLVLGATFGSF